MLSKLFTKPGRYVLITSNPVRSYDFIIRYIDEKLDYYEGNDSSGGHFSSSFELERQLDEIVKNRGFVSLTNVDL